MGGSATKAIKARDVTAFANVMKTSITPDFKYTEGPTAKPMGFDGMVAGMKAGLGMMKDISVADMHILSLKQTGDTATVLTSHKMVGHTLPGKDKKSHLMSFSGVSVDTYKKVGGAWKMSGMAWKSQEQKMDGKPMTGGM